ncbi:MAG: D-alanine--D-alanine ligase [Ruminococcus sp.]
MNIAVLAGGLSTERDVSISSGIKIAHALRSKGHRVVLVDVFMGYEEENCNPAELFEQNYSFAENRGVAEHIPDLAEVKAMRKDKSECFIGKNVLDICRYADITYLALHGGEGENGQIQATFDILGIKYTGSGHLGSALAMDKAITKALFIQNKIDTAEGEVFKKGDDTSSWTHFPCVIKPCSGGSSVGILKAENPEEFDNAVKEAFSFEDKIVVEQFIKGREFSVGVLGDKVLPPIEIIPTTGFYDYKSKYQAGLTVEVCPADITEDEDKVLRNSAYEVFKVLQLSCYGRVDFILAEDGKAYCLEANTLPGMTPTSLLPQEAAVEGMDYPTLCDKIVELSLKKYN